jgi:hypothetical protein
LLGRYFNGRFDVDISLAEARAIVMQISKGENTFWPNIFHWTRADELYSALLDRIMIFPDGLVNTDACLPERYMVEQRIHTQLRRFFEWAQRGLPRQEMPQNSAVEAQIRSSLESANAVVHSQFIEGGNDSAVDIIEGVFVEGIAGALYRKVLLRRLNTDSALVVVTIVRPVDDVFSACRERYSMRVEDELAAELQKLPVSRDETASVTSESSVDTARQYPAAFGAYFPHDDSCDVQEVVGSCEHWAQVCSSLMNTDAAAMVRTVSSIAVEYFLSKRSKPNARYAEFVEFAKKHLESSMYGATAQSVCGDVVCLFRKGEACLRVFRDWYALYLSERQVQRGLEWQVVADHHRQYIELISTAATSFEPTFLDMTGCRGQACCSPVAMLRASVDEARRVLGQWLCSIKRCPRLVFAVDFHPGTSLGDLHECYVSSDNQGGSSAVTIGALLLQGLDYVCAHVVVVMYWRHIASCALPLNYCRFPGCCQIKATLHGASTSSDSRSCRGAVKEYLGSETCRLFFSRLSSETASNIATQAYYVSRFAAQSAGESSETAAEYRYLNQRAISAESQSLLHYGDISPLTDYSDEETNKHNYGNAYKLIGAFIANVSVTAPDSTALVCEDRIPLRIIEDMYTSSVDCLYDESRYLVTRSAEYEVWCQPQSSKRQALKYVWLMDRLSIVSLSEASIYGFDRRLSSSSNVTFSAENLYSVEVLYGVVNKSNHTHNFERIVLTSSLTELKPGVSIIVDDSGGKLHCTFAISQGTDLNWLRTTIGLTTFATYSQTAEALIAKFGDVFKEQCIGSKCVSLRIDSTSVSNAPGAGLTRRRHSRAQKVHLSSAVLKVIREI